MRDEVLAWIDDLEKVESKPGVDAPATVRAQRNGAGKYQKPVAAVAADPLASPSETPSYDDANEYDG